MIIHCNSFTREQIRIPLKMMKRHILKHMHSPRWYSKGRWYMWLIMNPWKHLFIFFSQYWLWIGDHHSTVSNDLRSMVGLGRRVGQGHRCRLLLRKTVKLIGPCGNWTCNLRFINFTSKQTSLSGPKVTKQFSSKCDSV